METLRIRTSDHPYFAPFAALYAESFPAFEQRTAPQQQAAFADERYRLTVYAENGTLIGFIAAWTLSDCVYVEHLALNKTLRGKGYGSRLLRDFIAASAKRVLLEIDPVTDYVSAARLRFYKHCGLTENPYEHRHPPYHPEFKAHPLVVLTTEGTMTEESYLRFYRELRAVVMALPDVPGA